MAPAVKRRDRHIAASAPPRWALRPHRRWRTAGVAPVPSHRLRQYVQHGDVATTLTTPVIYSLLLPVVLLDLWLWLFQTLCFPVYGIRRVRRADFIVHDRQRLPYLNAIERLNCAYCAYVNGVFGYATEVAARTERYWCPIKHARTPRNPHSLYEGFAPYGAADIFSAITTRQLRARRQRLRRRRA